jgi:peptidoglycan hydrolase-like protein with peptidoglycan-binding domain
MRTPTTAAMFRALLIALCCAWLTGTAAAQSNQVRDAQQRLEALGHSPGQIDGLMGPQTRDALRAFQQDKSLPATGELDWETRLALSASVRSIDDAKPAPKPRSAPVPQVAISSLNPPGHPDIRSSEPSPPDAVTTVEGIVSSEIVQQAGGPEPARNTAGSTDRLDQETGPALTVASDGNDSLLSIGAAIILGLAATATWLALLLWVLRQRARRANASVGGE